MDIEIKLDSGVTVPKVIIITDIAAQTGICFLIYSIFMFPIAYFTYWMEHSVVGFLTYFGIFAAIFATMWSVQYFIWKKRIKELNDRLKQ